MTSAAHDALDGFRTGLARRIRTVLSGSGDPVPRPLSVSDDPGWFGPDSATWEVHADVSMLIGGLRALLLQTLHPLAMAGVSDHSRYREDPLGRLRRTAEFVGTTTFGSSDDADAAVARVRQVHESVTGLAPDGRPYAANDPHLLLWVHCTEIDSFLRARQRYGATPLRPGTPGRYVAEMATVAERLGVTDPPRSRAGLRSTLIGFRPELHVGYQARDTVRFLAFPSLPWQMRPTYSIIFGAAASMLPPFARRMLWLPVAPLAEPLAIRPAATALMRTLDWALGPHPVAAGHRT